MTPLKLELQAFLPFADKVVLDFETLTREKLFLVTGPTGCGKTSVFDAICYALFGVTSGSKRPEDRLKSQFAPLEKSCYVTLTFLDKGKVYTVHREPQQQKKRRTGKITAEPASAELLLPDGEKLTAVREVNQKIVSILGMNADQFTRIVMLPQGEFERFLSDSSKDKQEILRRIFDTGICDQFLEELKEADRAVEKKLLDRLAIQKDALQQLDVHADSATAREQKRDEPNVDLVIEEMNRLHIILNAEIADHKAQMDALSHALHTLSLPEAEAFNRRLALFEESRSFLIAHFEPERKKEWEAREQKIRRLRSIRGISILRQEYDRIRSDWAKTKALLTELELTLPHQQKMLKECLAEYEKQDAIRKELPEQLKRMQAIREQLIINETIRKTKEALEKNRLRAEKLQQAEQRTAAEKQLADLEGYLYEYAEVLLLGEKTDAAYGEQLTAFDQWCTANKQYTDNQAAFLAQDLKDGEPCPVCGSLHHPAPARASKIYASKNKVDRLMNLYQEKKDHHTALSQKLSDRIAFMHQNGQLDEPKRERLLPTLKATQKVYARKQEELAALPETIDLLKGRSADELKLLSAKLHAEMDQQMLNLSDASLKADPETQKF